MLGRWLENRRNARRVSPVSAVTVPPAAGVLSGRVLDLVAEPVRNAELTVADAVGRTLVRGGTDPYGQFVATVPTGEYRVAVESEGYAPHRGNVTVVEGGHASLGDVVLQPVPPQTPPAAGDWTVDPAHSSIGFTARHIGLARIHGRFNTFAGALRVGGRMEESALHVVIDAASIDTGVQMRDDHLKSAEFLDVERFPTLEFYSDRFVHRGANRWHVIGALSLHGVTRTVTLDTEYLGLGNGMEGETRAACRATAELRREDFTISWQTMLARGIAAIGPSIEVTLDIQVVPKG
ncbi:YceI family protein [Streptomyces sp. JNUCC 64]